MDQQVCLLTGSDGFLGTYLSVALIEKGIRVIEYDKTKGRDINNGEQFAKILRESKATVVVHLAAMADLNICATKQEDCFHVNVEGTKTILQICKECNVRILFASTCCVYGNSEVPISSESSPTSPTEIYAQSKLEAEKLVLNAGKPHTILRLATFYGPMMRRTLAPAIFLANLVSNRPFLEIHGTGKQTRTFTYVEDIVSGIVAVMTTPNWYPIVNVSTEQSHSVLEVAAVAMKGICLAKYFIFCSQWPTKRSSCCMWQTEQGRSTTSP